MKYQRVWLLFLFCLSFWNMNAQHFVIKGQTNGYIPDGSILYLGYWNGMGPTFCFTSDVVRNGTFHLEGERKKTPDLIYLYGTEKAIGTLGLRLWVGDDTIRISANSEVPETWIVKNNMPQQSEEDLYRQLKGKDNMVMTSRMNSRQLWDKSLSPDSIRILSSQMIQNDLPGQIRILNNLHEQPQLTDVGLVWLFLTSAYASWMTSPEHLRTGKETYAKLTGKQKQTYYGKLIKSCFYPNKAPERGDQYIDAELTDLEGNSCKLSDYLNKNKYILLDFWDQYCAPCVKSVSGLKELASSCPDKLAIISINVGSRESWEKGSRDFLWDNLSDGQGLAGIAARYGVKSIPFFILIAPNGRIEECWKGYAIHRSHMEEEIMEIILPNSSLTEAPE